MPLNTVIPVMSFRMEFRALAKTKETAEHSEEVAHILEGYHQGLFELLQIIAVKLDKMTDGLAEILITDSLNEFDKGEKKCLNKYRTKLVNHLFSAL